MEWGDGAFTEELLEADIKTDLIVDFNVHKCILFTY